MKMSKIDEKISNSDKIEELLINSDDTQAITFVNPFSYFMINKYLRLDEIDNIYIDGILLLKLFNFFKKKKLSRLSFDYSSIADTVFNYSIANRKKLSFIGASTDEVNKAILNIKKKHPNINITYYRNGFFSTEEERNTAIDSCISKSDILICGLGTPLQENFILDVKLRAKIKSKNMLLFTCGGFISQTAIKTDFYHPIVKKYNLMWLQRFLMFKHVRKRFLINYPAFVVKFVYLNLKK